MLEMFETIAFHYIILSRARRRPNINQFHEFEMGFRKIEIYFNRVTENKATAFRLVLRNPRSTSKRYSTLKADHRKAGSLVDAYSITNQLFVTSAVAGHWFHAAGRS